MERTESKPRKPQVVGARWLVLVTTEYTPECRIVDAPSANAAIRKVLDYLGAAEVEELRIMRGDVLR